MGSRVCRPLTRYRSDVHISHALRAGHRPLNPGQRALVDGGIPKHDHAERHTDDGHDDRCPAQHPNGRQHRGDWHEDQQAEER
jgi:hypothetical protein